MEDFKKAFGTFGFAKVRSGKNFRTFSYESTLKLRKKSEALKLLLPFGFAKVQ
ncbi:hypothetical protein KBD33_00820 [Candidatus Gracilibacteria bacterium]|nr:hypothetical protein [Candidatus Gracilibacteria bacterium]